jgi:hypothetical protein
MRETVKWNDVFVMKRKAGWMVAMRARPCQAYHFAAKEKRVSRRRRAAARNKALTLP